MIVSHVSGRLIIDYLSSCDCLCVPGIILTVVLYYRWIGDGRFFAVSAIDTAVGARKIRVYTREGVLHSTSESLTGLEHSLDWR